MYVHTDECRDRFNRALADQLRAELSVRDIPNDQVAELMGIHRGTLYKYMREGSSVPADFVYGFCRVIEVDPAGFFQQVIDSM